MSGLQIVNADKLLYQTMPETDISVMKEYHRKNKSNIKKVA